VCIKQIFDYCLVKYQRTSIREKVTNLTVINIIVNLLWMWIKPSVQIGNGRHLLVAQNGAGGHLANFHLQIQTLLWIFVFVVGSASWIFAARCQFPHLIFGLSALLAFLALYIFVRYTVATVRQCMRMRMFYRYSLFLHRTTFHFLAFFLRSLMLFHRTFIISCLFTGFKIS